MTKNIITKETIAEELAGKNDRWIRARLAFSLGQAAFVVIIFLIICSIMLDVGNVSIWGWIVYFVMLLLCLFISVISILSVFSAILQNKRLRNGAFVVVTDEVTYKEERDVWERRIVYVEKIIHFYKYGDIVVDPTCYEMTSKGDIFYIVLSTPDSQIPQKYYPAKLYEYKE